MIKTLEAQIGQFLLGCKYPVRRGIVVQEQDPLGDLTLAFSLQNVLQLYIYIFTAIGLLPGGSGYFTCKQNMKLVIIKFKSGGLHEEHVMATWNLGNHLSICL